MITPSQLREDNQRFLNQTLNLIIAEMQERVRFGQEIKLFRYDCGDGTSPRTVRKVMEALRARGFVVQKGATLSTLMAWIPEGPEGEVVRDQWDLRVDAQRAQGAILGKLRQEARRVAQTTLETRCQYRWDFTPTTEVMALVTFILEKQGFRVETNDLGVTIDWSAAPTSEEKP